MDPLKKFPGGRVAQHGNAIKLLFEIALAGHPAPGATENPVAVLDTIEARQVAHPAGRENGGLGTRACHEVDQFAIKDGIETHKEADKICRVGLDREPRAIRTIAMHDVDVGDASFLQCGTLNRIDLG